MLLGIQGTWVLLYPIRKSNNSLAFITSVFECNSADVLLSGESDCGILDIYQISLLSER